MCEWYIRKQKILHKLNSCVPLTVRYTHLSEKYKFFQMLTYPSEVHARTHMPNNINIRRKIKKTCYKDILKVIFKIFWPCYMLNVHIRILKLIPPTFLYNNIIIHWAASCFSKLIPHTYKHLCTWWWYARRQDMWVFLSYTCVVYKVTVSRDVCMSIFLPSSYGMSLCPVGCVCVCLFFYYYYFRKKISYSPLLHFFFA